MDKGEAFSRECDGEARMSTYEITEADWVLCQEVAARIADGWQGYVEAEDLEQECLIWFLEHPKYATEYRDNGKSGERKLRNSLVNKARKYAIREKAARSGYDQEAEYYYSLEEIERLLPPFFSRDWMGSGLMTMPESGRSSNRPIPSEGNNLVVKLADIAKAFKRLSTHQQLLLKRIYGEPGDYRLLLNQEASRNGVTVNTQRQRIRRVLGRMRKTLGGKRPYRDEAEDE